MEKEEILELLELVETEMRYAGFSVLEDDNSARNDVYNKIVSAINHLKK